MEASSQKKSEAGQQMGIDQKSNRGRPGGLFQVVSNGDSLLHLTWPCKSQRMGESQFEMIATYRMPFSVHSVQHVQGISVGDQSVGARVSKSYVLRAIAGHG